MADIVHYDSLGSTNEKAKELARLGRPAGTVVWADHQDAGRGRGHNQWHSPPGGLYLSLLLRPKEGRPATDLSLLAGVAVVQAVRELLPKSVEVSVKWPNDCLLNWKKVAGILVEHVSEVDMAVVGIGLNVNLPAEELTVFEDRPFGATSFQVECGGAFSLQDSLNMVVTKTLLLRALYERDGMDSIRYLWEKNCRFVGKKVEVSETGRADVGEQTRGTFLGLDDSGALLLGNEKGDKRAFFSGVITCCWR